MVTEIIIYRLKENMDATHWEAFIEKSLPAMKRWNIQVMNYGFSLEDPLTFHLVRSFDSLNHRNDTLDKFYGSDDWIKRARTEIIESIADYKTTIFEN